MAKINKTKIDALIALPNGKTVEDLEAEWSISGNNRNVWGQFRGQLAVVLHNARGELTSLVADAEKLKEQVKVATQKVLTKAGESFHRLNEEIQKGMTPARFLVDGKRIVDIVIAKMGTIKNLAIRKLAKAVVQRSLKLMQAIGKAALKALGFVK